MSQTINLDVKLCAYTKLPLPNYITEAPDDGKIYGRKDKDWTEITGSGANILTPEGSGLRKVDLESGESELWIKQYLVTERPLILEDDTTYYIIENTPDLYINGGTAYSNGSNEYVDNSEFGLNIIGGQAVTNLYELNLLPIDSKGVNNG